MGDCHLRERIRAVLRAQSTADPFDDLVAHAKGVESGPAILPVIREELLRANWSSSNQQGQLAALTALMLIARDVDEVRARELAKELQQSGRLPAVVSKRLESIALFTLNDFEKSEIFGLKVYISHKLTQATRIVRLLRRWLARVPEKDLVGISRLFVITDGEQEQFWGQYLQVLAVVSLVWRGGSGQGMRARLATEYTLYHELGHHYHRQARGSRQEHERLADCYASAKFASSHPVVGGGVLGKVVIAWLVGRVSNDCKDSA